MLTLVQCSTSECFSSTGISFSRNRAIPFGLIPFESNVAAEAATAFFSMASSGNQPVATRVDSPTVGRASPMMGAAGSSPGILGRARAVTFIRRFAVYSQAGISVVGNHAHGLGCGGCCLHGVEFLRHLAAVVVTAHPPCRFRWTRSYWIFSPSRSGQCGTIYMCK